MIDNTLKHFAEWLLHSYFTKRDDGNNNRFWWNSTFSSAYTTEELIKIYNESQ